MCGKDVYIKMVEQYLKHSREILSSESSTFKFGSKGSGLVSLFGYQNEYDLRDGFPLLTTKKMFTRGIIHELLWFFKGDTNIKYLEDNNVSIWRGNSFEHNLPGMIKEGIFPEHIERKEKKYGPEWDKAMEDYGQMIKESDEFDTEFIIARERNPKLFEEWFIHEYTMYHWNSPVKYYDVIHPNYKWASFKTNRIEAINKLNDLKSKWLKPKKENPINKKWFIDLWEMWKSAKKLLWKDGVSDDLISEARKYGSADEFVKWLEKNNSY